MRRTEGCLENNNRFKTVLNRLDQCGEFWGIFMMTLAQFTEEMETLFGFHSRNPMRSVIKAWWTLGEVTSREHILLALEKLRTFADEKHHFPLFRHFSEAVGSARRGLSCNSDVTGCDYCRKGIVYFDDTRGRTFVGSCSLCRTGPQWMNPVDPRKVDAEYQHGGSFDARIMVNMKNGIERVEECIKLKDIPSVSHWQDKEDYRSRNIADRGED